MKRTCNVNGTKFTPDIVSNYAKKLYMNGR